ncbi:hypothetical protein ACFPQ5_20420 [Massilia suwonensis]|uniref:H-NS histone family protein n=2 Tax=Massilia suwonensis TaxID=648895 RepID=A0ABW0MQQ3_9BURK
MKGNTMFQNEAAAPAHQEKVIHLSPANTLQAPAYQAEQFSDLSDAFSEQWVAAATADTESVEISRLDDLMATVKKLSEAIKARQDELSAKAKEKQAADKLKELLESGVTDPAKLREAIDAMHPVPEKSASRSRNNAPKVYEYLLDEKHNDGVVDLKKGHNGSFMGAPQPWHHKINKKPDTAFFRKADEIETAKMQKALDDFNAKQAGKAPRVPKQ